MKDRKNKSANDSSDLILELSNEQIETISKGIKKTKTLPFLPFIKEDLENRGFKNLPKREPWFYIDEVTINEMTGFLFINMDGFYSNCVNNDEITFIGTWDKVYNLQLFDNQDPEREDMLEGLINLLISFDENKNPDEAMVLSLFIEGHSSKSGSPFSVIQSIYDNIWKKMIDKYRGKPIMWGSHIDWFTQEVFASKEEFIVFYMDEAYEGEGEPTKSAIHKFGFLLCSFATTTDNKFSKEEIKKVNEIIDSIAGDKKVNSEIFDWFNEEMGKVKWKFGDKVFQKVLHDCILDVGNFLNQFDDSKKRLFINDLISVANSDGKILDKEIAFIEMLCGVIEIEIPNILDADPERRWVSKKSVIPEITQKMCANGFTGKGVFNYSTGTFIGDWKDGERVNGTYKWQNGDKYVGDYKDSQKHGKGSFTWENGDRYDGEWDFDKNHGSGMYTWGNGNKYTGDFHLDKKHGNGIEEIIDGNKYEGTFNDDFKHGIGKSVWTDGDSYIGEFANNNFHGKGIYITGGKKYSGVWKDGKIQDQRMTSSEENEMISIWSKQVKELVKTVEKKEKKRLQDKKAEVKPKSNETEALKKFGMTKKDLAEKVLKNIAVSTKNPEAYAFVKSVSSKNADLSKIREQLENGMDKFIDFPDEDGYTALHYACWDNKLKIVILLIDNGASVNVLSSFNETPLNMAVVSGHLEIVQFFVDCIISDEMHDYIEERNLTPNPFHSKKGSTLIRDAVLNQHWNIFDLLINAVGPNLDVLNEPCSVGVDGETNFFLAIEKFYKSKNIDYDKERLETIRSTVESNKEEKDTPAQKINNEEETEQERTGLDRIVFFLLSFAHIADGEKLEKVEITKVRNIVKTLLQDTSIQADSLFEKAANWFMEEMIKVEWNVRDDSFQAILNNCITSVEDTFWKSKNPEKRLFINQVIGLANVDGTIGDGEIAWIERLCAGIDIEIPNILDSNPEGRWDVDEEDSDPEKLDNEKVDDVTQELTEEMLSAGYTGKGTYTSSESEGVLYVGEFKNGAFNGQGVFTLPDGTKYVGKFKNDMQNGQGTLTFTDGENYVGEWKDGAKCGQGTWTWPDGTKYIGEFEDGLFHGQGTVDSATGEVFEGEFQKNKKHGKGIYIWPNGKKYEGEWKDDNFHGQGTLTSSEGDVYVGEFKGGSFHGQGTFTSTDGDVIKGLFENGKYIGLDIDVVVENKTDEPKESKHKNSTTQHIDPAPNEETSIWKIIQYEFINLGKESVIKKEFSEMILEKYPHIKKGTLSAQISIQVINKRSRTNYAQCSKERVCGDDKFDFLFEQEDKTLCKYDEFKHGLWEIYKRDDGKLDVRIVK